MTDKLTDVDIMQILDRANKATPGPWEWDSYSTIAASVPQDSPLNAAGEDDPPVAFIGVIAQAPEYEGMGDELHHPETRANAKFIAAARTDIPRLVRNLQETKAALKHVGQSKIKLADDENGWSCMWCGEPEREDSIEHMNWCPTAIATKALGDG